MEEERALQLYQSTMPTAAGTLSLAIMSDQEFEAKLAILKKGRERIATIQRELMEPGVDFGEIPGTDKPTLLKPGAEKLCDFYHLVADMQSERTTCSDGTRPPISYTTKCFIHLGDLTGPIIAVGQGSANSWEKKYRYRTAERACPECGAMKAIIRGKPEWERDEALKGGFLCFDKRGGCGTKFTKDDPRIIHQQLGQIENPDPDDLDNTLLKMSEKRGYVDGVLRGTATSGLFAQDLEDMVDQAAVNPTAAAQAIEQAVIPQSVRETPKQEPAKGKAIEAAEIKPQLPFEKPEHIGKVQFDNYAAIWLEAQHKGLKLTDADNILPGHIVTDITAMGKALRQRINEHDTSQNPGGKPAQELLYGKEATA